MMDSRGESPSAFAQQSPRDWKVREIGFTGGEPFMNPQIADMVRDSLARNYRVLILTNAMQPMMRPRMRDDLRQLCRDFGDRLALRVSLDHWTEGPHDAERGSGSFARALAGLAWLRDTGIATAVAGRTFGGEPESVSRAGYAGLFRMHSLKIDAQDPAQLVLFPEMDETAEALEITTACWKSLGRTPASVMCASSRMVVRRKGAPRPTVLSCTLLPYDLRFELGETLAEAERPVALNHPFCAQFCVLGGASCSA